MASRRRPSGPGSRRGRADGAHGRPFRYDQRLHVACWVQRGTGFSEYDLTVLSDVDPDDAGQTKATGWASRRMRTHNRSCGAQGRAHQGGIEGLRIFPFRLGAARCYSCPDVPRRLKTTLSQRDGREAGQAVDNAFSAFPEGSSGVSFIFVDVRVDVGGLVLDVDVDARLRIVVIAHHLGDQEHVYDCTDTGYTTGAQPQNGSAYPSEVEAMETKNAQSTEGSEEVGGAY